MSRTQARMRAIQRVNSQLEFDESARIVREANMECPLCKQVSIYYELARIRGLIGKLEVRLGKYGAFVGCTRWPECTYTANLDAPLVRKGPGDKVLLEDIREAVQGPCT